MLYKDTYNTAFPEDILISDFQAKVKLANLLDSETFHRLELVTDNIYSMTGDGYRIVAQMLKTRSIIDGPLKLTEIVQIIFETYNELLARV